MAMGVFFLGAWRGGCAGGHTGCSSYWVPAGTTRRAAPPGTFAPPGTNAEPGWLRIVILVQSVGVGGLGKLKDYNDGMCADKPAFI